MLRTVYLHGALADRFGRDPIVLFITGLRDLVLGLDVARPGFRAALSEVTALALVRQVGPGAYVEVTPADFALGLGTSEELHLAGSVEGAGFEVATFTFLGWTGWSAVAAYFAAVVLVNLAVGAIIQSMVKVPGAGEGPGPVDQRPSHIFNGPVNVNEQGYPVPLVYGEFIVGSITISPSVSVEQLITTIPDDPSDGGSTGGAWGNDGGWGTGGGN